MGAPEAAAPRWRYAAWPVLVALCVALYAWRMSGVAAVEPVTSHLSNAYLSAGAVLAVAGPAAFVDRARRPRALVVAAVLVVVNVVGEVVLAVLGLGDDVSDALGGVNTADPWDAVAGVLAVGVVVALLPVSRPARPAP